MIEGDSTAATRLEPYDDRTSTPQPRQRAAPEEDRIFALLARGDRRGAETELFGVYGVRILARCARMVRNQSRAEDVCQQVFLEACRDLSRFERRSSLFTWLCRIAKNRCLDTIKAQRSSDKYIDRDGELAFDAADLDANPGVLVDRERLRTALEDCLRRLPGPMAETVRLRFQNDDLSYEELGLVMNTNPGTLNRRVIRALPLLEDCLKRKGWPGE